MTIVQPIPLTGAGVAISEPGYLPLDVAGAWTMQVERDDADGQPDGLAARFDVLTADGEVSTPEIAPTPSAPQITSAVTASTVAP